jgi:hypothetical protein
MISVEIMRPDQGADIRTFDKHEILIGRKPDNDIVIEERDVSGRHACLRVADGAVTIIDLGSTNGTYVDGAPIEARVLHADALVQVAGHTLKVHASRAPEAPERASVDPPLLGESPPPLLGVDDLPPLLLGVNAAPATTPAAEPALLDAPSGRDLGAASAGTDRHATVPPKLLDSEASPHLPAAPALPVSAGGTPQPTTHVPAATPGHPRGESAALVLGKEAPPAPICGPGSSLPEAALLERWRAPGVTELFARAGAPLYWRSGQVETTDREPTSLAAVRAAIRALAGIDPELQPRRHSLADGAIMTAGVVAGAPWLLLERAHRPFKALDAWVEAGQLDAAAAARLRKAVAKGRPLLAYGCELCLLEPLLLALAATAGRDGRVLRAPRSPLTLPEGALPLDLEDGLGGDTSARASVALGPALALAAASRPEWVVILGPVRGEEPRLRALVRRGVPVLVGVGCDCVEAAGAAGGALGWAEGPSIDYAAAIAIGPGDDGKPVLREVIELCGDGDAPDDDTPENERTKSGLQG